MMPQIIPPVFHPIFVHAPIILVPLAALFASLHARFLWARQAVPMLLALAAVASVVALVTGLDSLEDMEHTIEGTPAGDVAEVHEVLGWVTTVSTVAAFGLWFWRRDRLYEGAWATAWPALLWVAFAAVAVTGWYGGALVFEYGLGTP